MNKDKKNQKHTPRLIIVTGASGAGRNTALNAIEDCGFHRIDNIPPNLLERLFSDPMEERDLVLGFGALAIEEFEELGQILEKLSKHVEFEIIYLEASETALLRRFSETRRSHPHSGTDALREGIAYEAGLMRNLRKLSSIIIDTSNLTPHQLGAEVRRLLDLETAHHFVVNIMSFSYKRGLPRQADMVFDCRFLRNPHWETDLRELTGLKSEVQDYVSQDGHFDTFLGDILRILKYTIPAIQSEGRSYFTVAFGCSGGKHRSVTMAEKISNVLRADGRPVVTTHRELEAKAE